tara:strand:+ start:101 stop:640 length:540 start_codon:yes stop_codon:yes gene_type:complete
MIDPETLRKLLHYNPDTGLLVWKARTADVHKNDRGRRIFNTRFAGTQTFTADDGGGYRRGMIFGAQYLAHRVAWAITHGEWPVQIDHVNRLKHDNRLSNLRNVTHQENLLNKSLYESNTSGNVGVSWFKRTGKWVAKIGHNTKVIHLGYFHDKADAIAARKAAEVKYGYHENHGQETTR